MELYQLRSFIAVAEVGLLSRAAERIHSSQPAISAHIKALEEELDVLLFQRTPKGMRLTVEGKLLRDKAAVILNATEDLKITASSFKEIVRGNVRVGLHTDPQMLRITDILSQFQKKYPELSLNYLQRMSWQSPEQLISGELDAAFVYSKPADERLGVELLHQVPLVIVAPVIWADKLRNATLMDTTALPWIWTDERCPYHGIATALFAKIGHEPPKAVIVEQESAIAKLVSEGVGLSLMPRDKAEEESATNQLYIADIEASTLDLSFIYLLNRKHDPIVQACLEVVRSIWSDRPAMDLRRETDLRQLAKS